MTNFFRVFLSQHLGALSPMELEDLESCLQTTLGQIATVRQRVVSRPKSKTQQGGTGAAAQPGDNDGRGSQPALP